MTVGTHDGQSRAAGPGDAADEARRALSAASELAAVMSETLADQVGSLSTQVLQVLTAGGKLMFCGNGGSAADAQHLAAEYVVRFKANRAALAAIALTTDTSILTAGGNDLGFDTIFARQVEAVGRRGDLLILHSTSGTSQNLITAARSARELGIGTVGILARDGGRLKDEVNGSIIVPTEVTARAQEMHLAIGHIVCDWVDSQVMAGAVAGTRGDHHG